MVVVVMSLSVSLQKVNFFAHMAVRARGTNCGPSAGSSPFSEVS